MLVLYKKYNTRDGRTKIKQVSKSSLKRGDIVYIQKNILHWHGALDRSQFAHIAFNAFTSKGKESKTIWYD
jgi:quercetin dioxygenase-like cupin family protein